MTPRETPRVSSPALPPPAATPLVRPAASPPTNEAMDSSAGRNLPPMSMSLPPPERGLSAMTPMNSSMSHLPAPPSQWQNTDEAMRQWLQTKAEEDRRKQEEERTRQELYRLDQRRVEQSMLREALKAGVPPYMVPLIFSSLSGGANAQWTQQYISQMTATSSQLLPPGQPQTLTPQSQHEQYPPPQQHQQQHAPPPASHRLQPQPQPPPPPQPQSMPPPSQVPAAPQHTSSEGPWDNRMIPPNPYAAHPPPPTIVAPPSQSAPSSPSHASYTRVSTLRQPSQQTTGPPIPNASSLSRINTGEMHIHQPPPNTGVTTFNAASPVTVASQPQPPSQQASTLKSESGSHRQSQQTQSPSIHFHHWVPPNQSQPNTPSGKSPNNSPYSAHAASHLRSEYQNSPKKRKSQAAHQAAPPPSQRAETSRPSPGPTPPRGNGPRGHLRHQNESSSQGQESRHGDLLEPGRPGGQMHVTSLVRSADEADDRGGSRRGSNSEREAKREKGNTRFAGGRNGNLPGNYAVGSHRDDSQSNPGGPEQPASSNGQRHSFGAYGPSYHRRDSSGPSNTGPADTNSYRSPSDPTPIHSQDHHGQRSTST
ncbi:hypothetical protein FQN50_003928 [Emmonsiellopsis sp. PD_5]|nr:hypothetical protein FQN50_003928 [Emmonsiellopsis sp. PD_5]